MGSGSTRTLDRAWTSVDPPRDIVVASPEDVIAQKLYWYRLGDEISERQWNDAIGVLKVAARREHSTNTWTTTTRVCCIQ